MNEGLGGAASGVGNGPIVPDIAPSLTSWRSYEYFPGGHNYLKPHYDASGGPEGRPCLWTDDSLWTIDTPENPHSILFLLHYRFWDNLPPLDLRGAELRFRLRGDNLNLHGGRCHFWAVTHLGATTRWHLVRQGIPISLKTWGEETILRLEADPAQWHCSFVSTPEANEPTSLESTLQTCFSYGFSLVGFSEKVTGRIGLADFRLLQAVDPNWPYIFEGEGGAGGWLTVSRCRRSQVVVSDKERVNEESGLCLMDDFVVFHGLSQAFTYLAFLPAAAVGRRDLRDALLMLSHDGSAFNPEGGAILFFVEHAASETRWALRVEFGCRDEEPYREQLLADPAYWIGISGFLPLAEVLTRYDYLGFLLLNPQSEPSGTWCLRSFSLGPNI